MREFSYPIKETLLKGLAPTHSVRNLPLLIESVGAVPYEGVLQALETFSVIDTSSLNTTFPYPQLFVLSDVIVVCTETAFYEIISGSLSGAVINNLVAGATWDCADFKSYVYFTNGKQVVTRKNGVYSVDSEVPFALSVCNYNGQILLGSPNIPYSE